VFGLNRLYVPRRPYRQRVSASALASSTRTLDTFLVPWYTARGATVRLEDWRFGASRRRALRLEVIDDVEGDDIRKETANLRSPASRPTAWSQRLLLVGTTNRRRGTPNLSGLGCQRFDPGTTAWVKFPAGRSRSPTWCGPGDPETFISHRITRSQYYRACLTKWRRVAEEALPTTAACWLLHMAQLT
jgi:hypothetical protein